MGNLNCLDCGASNDGPAETHRAPRDRPPKRFDKEMLRLQEVCWSGDGPPASRSYSLALWGASDAVDLRPYQRVVKVTEQSYAGASGDPQVSVRVLLVGSQSRDAMAEWGAAANDHICVTTAALVAVGVGRRSWLLWRTRPAGVRGESSRRTGGMAGPPRWPNPPPTPSTAHGLG